MTFFAELAEDRRLFIEALRRNKGDINLGIFEDFYPDRAHFIYELLQNAEDAGATEASFELMRDGCTFIHNGLRHFNEPDIRGITGIFNSTKKDNLDKIGKFGVGFKSVFVYTDSPVIYSRDYSFRISQLVLPEPIPQRVDLGATTRFEFPFNSPKKDAAQAFSEVRAGLDAVSERTLLYLNNLRYISWKCEGSQAAVFRVEHTPSHVEVLKEAENRKLVSSHWLRFTAPVTKLEHQKVAVAYELGFVGDVTEFDPSKSIAQQMKIIAAVRGQVSVFFPAEKETSGLRFHLHAPFVPELSRASIKNCPENATLFEQLAALAARSLHEVKALGLLTGEFLAVLPHDDDALEERYEVIRDAIIAEMQAQPLTPTYRGGHAPANTLLQGRAILKELLTDADLQRLLGRDDKPTWAIGASQRNSNQDRFLSSLDIEDWDADSLAELLGEHACEGGNAWPFQRGPDVMNWLPGKSDEWHQRLYAMLFKLLEDDGDFSVLEDAKIVRLSDGSYSRADGVFFPSGPATPDDPFPRVAASVLSSGSRKAQQVHARKLLEELGVREVGEAEEIEQILANRYAKGSKFPADDIYVADLRRFVTFLEAKPAEARRFQGAFVFKVKADKPSWATAAAVYLDRPFKETGLRAYHDKIPDRAQKRYPLSEWYSECGIEREKLMRFAEAVGCATTFSEFAEQTSCYENPSWRYLSSVGGERLTSPRNIDYKMVQSAQQLLAAGNTELSRLVWKTMCQSGSRYLFAMYQKNASHGPHYADSQLVEFLKRTAWVPQKDGQFVMPRCASRDRLLKGFTFDEAYKWLERVRFGEDEKKTAAERAEWAKKRAALGFESDEVLERAQEFSRLSHEEQKRILSEHRARPVETDEDFPVRPVRNRELRHRRVNETAKNTSAKESQSRQRTVAVGYDAAKAEARLYLQEQYTNENGVMFCQVCKAALPFRLPSGAYYFDAVEAVAGLPKRFREAHLALCPNHAAMFRCANDERDEMQELIEVAVGLEIDVTLAGEPSTIFFTEMHLADIKASLAALENDDTPQGVGL
ncbi:hypothetical protein WQE_15316 [Paraburkholderia hospita]|uniref:Sacsin/Nov domain-containing protein n=1 Tax=Paraburkholderia hospita TaxID=169430 RepID=A0ABP2PVE3_9BURK|nr:hypothetical protein [Paraburkholderia hospita]EIN00412.1 hypothetical protein WQE_15316 [Paraburkholderia hospita]OUL88423.1 hypothetical protein CA602_11215 [Paraburkholderia hospita]